MVNDTVVGVIGALVIVGSMTGVIQALQDDGATGGDVVGPPPGPGTSRFAADGCRALTLTWTPDRAALEEIVGPHWTPVEGPTEDRGVFLLFAWTCPSTAVDGRSRGGDSGAAALVPVETPDDTRGVDVDAWVAAPELIGAGTSPVTRVLRTHNFTVTAGSGSVGITEAPVLDSRQVRMVIETPGGQLEATATLGGSSTSRDLSTAVVGTREDTFSVMRGTEEMQRQTTGSATVQTSGTTWVERLGLEPTPSQVAYDTAFSWDFTLRHEPWDASGDAAMNATLAGR